MFLPINLLYNAAKYLTDKVKPEIAWEMPNLETGTLGGYTFWITEKTSVNYRLQTNIFSRHARILDSTDTRIAWGDRAAMYKRFRQLTVGRRPLPGEVISINRKGLLYTHFGIYVGKGQVIHYAGEDGDFQQMPQIQQTDMEVFLRGSTSYHIVEFPDRIMLDTGLPAIFDNAFLRAFETVKDHRLYTHTETLERAKSQLGKSQYDLISNNCEHFAMWCKTGLAKSGQVDQILSGITLLSVPIKTDWE